MMFSRTSGRHLPTEGEQDVLALIVQGLNNAQIAGKLMANPSIIKSHASNILPKLGATSRDEALALALQHKLIT